MRVIGIIGSPRKHGSTALLVRKALEGAASAGAEISEVYLNELNFRGCQACMHCKTNEICRQEDDMSRLAQEIRQADGIVVGSPVYMQGISSQTKTFFDRLYAFCPGPGFPSRMPNGKKAVFVFSHNNPNDKAFIANVEPLPDFFRKMGIAVIDPLFGAGGAKALEDPTFMQKVFRAGVDLV